MLKSTGFFSSVAALIFFLLSAAPSRSLTIGGHPRTVTAVPVDARPVTLEKCIEEALESNATLAAERLGLGELEGQMTQALATGLPSLSMNGTWTRGRDPSFALDESFSFGGDYPPADTSGSGSPFDSLFGGIDFFPAPEDIPAQTFWRTGLHSHWEIRPGLILNAVGAADLGLKRQLQMVKDTEHRTIEAVMAAYYGVIMTGEQLDAVDAELAAMREFLEVTRRRFSLGLSTSLDTLRAAVSLANLEPRRRSAAQNLRDAGAQLNGLLGRPERSPLTVFRDIRIETVKLDPEAAAGRTGERPDIRQLELLRDILKKNRGAISANRHPYLSADASYGYVTGDIRDMFDTGHDYWSVSVTLGIPIFDGLLTRGRVREAVASIARMERQIEEARRQARIEIHSLLGDLDAAWANFEAAGMNVEAAENALSLMTMSYELGKTDYLSVLNMQAERFQAETNLIMARNEVLTLTASLKRALGLAPSLPLEDVRKALDHYDENTP